MELERTVFDAELPHLAKEEHPFAQKLKEFYQEFVFLFFPDKVFLQRKFHDHRIFTTVCLTGCAIIGTLMWWRDHMLDPAGASKTILLRLSFLLTILVALAVARSSRIWLLKIFATANLLTCVVIYVVINNQITNAILFSIAGFWFFQLIALMVLQCFSLRWNYFFALVIAAIPQLLGRAGYIHGYGRIHYAIQIWPITLFTLFFQTALAHSYLLRYRIERKLEAASNTDPLTGVNNRRYFMPLLAQEVRRAQRQRQNLSLLVFDIDHFKRINDTFGHAVGDNVICSLAGVCQKSVREIDSLARIGGEEFAVLLIGSPLHSALKAADRIRLAIEAHDMRLDASISIHLSVSIGVAELKQEDDDDDQLFMRADSALYKAKQMGRNRVCS